MYWLWENFRKLRWFTNGHVVEWALDDYGVYQGSLFVTLTFWQPNWRWFKWDSEGLERCYFFWALWLHVSVALPREPVRLHCGWCNKNDVPTMKCDHDGFYL